MHKILGGGSHVDQVRAYVSGGPRNKLSKDDSSEFAERMKGGGWTAAKVGISRDQSWVGLDNRGLDENAEGYANLREALGRDFDIAVHCHWEFDFNSALRLARVVAPIRPFWMEDPMPIEFNEQWVRLTAQSPVPILCEENLYRRPAFRPFIE